MAQEATKSSEPPRACRSREAGKSCLLSSQEMLTVPADLSTLRTRATCAKGGAGTLPTQGARKALLTSATGRPRGSGTLGEAQRLGQHGASVGSM